MLGTRLPKPRQFHYEPFYYDPAKDKDVEKKIKFRRRFPGPLKRRSTWSTLLLLGLLIYLFYFLTRFGR